jgi:outer membrane protein assembly factor BamB
MKKRMLRRDFLKLMAMTAGSGLMTRFGDMLEPTQASAQGPGYQTFLPCVASSADPTGSWPMVGANPQRTSWTPQEVRGQLTPVWVRPIEPYINYKIQIIAAYGKLFISTARGLYAINAENGNIDWIYPTEMPLGNSPTVADGIVYVGGYDRKIHALDVVSGKIIPTWTFYEAEAGFETNPLVINQVLYAGNRDGYFYALDAKTGVLKWKYKTGGPILFSAAYQNGILYFASNDSYAYAIKAVPNDPNNTSGELVWKSAKLPGAGFHSYWPVIYTDRATNTDYVIFSGSQNILHDHTNFFGLERDDLFPNHEHDPWGTLIAPSGKVSGDWVPGTVTIDVSKITNHLEQKPSRRVVFVLNAVTGEEYTFDSNGNGTPEYAPFTWAGTTHSGNKYPPVIGRDGVIYQFANYVSAPYITRGQVAGWKFGAHHISRVANSDSAVDEPMAYSVGGNLIYWNLCNDRASGCFDVAIPYDQQDRAWTYFSYNLRKLLPGYQPLYYGNDFNGWGMYGNVNGVYGRHGTQNPPVPYRGKVYMQKGNSIIAFGKNGGSVTALAMASKVAAGTMSTPITIDTLQMRLEEEIRKIVNDSSMFLRPGYYGTGFINNSYQELYADRLTEYFHNPSDTIVTLIQALPYLSLALAQQTKDYLQAFFAKFPLNNVVSVGWRNGLPREVFDIPSEVASYYTSGPQTTSLPGPWWQSFPPDSFYEAWKYAQVFGGAKGIFDEMKGKLQAPPSDPYLLMKPYIHNAYISGYRGYLELEKLAYPDSTSNRTTLDHLLALRANGFTKDSPYIVPDTNDGFVTIDYNRALNISRNFMFLVPELGDYLHQYALSKVQQAISEYCELAPYWFVSKYDAASGEAVLEHLFDYQAIFQAKAYILKESRQELTKYLDVPAFDKGDLFYIQNLVAAIQAA